MMLLVCSIWPYLPAGLHTNDTPCYQAFELHAAEPLSQTVTPRMFYDTYVLGSARLSKTLANFIEKSVEQQEVVKARV